MRFPRPKILCVDTPDIHEPLASAGYNSVAGTWGQPYLGKKHELLFANTELPNYGEREVVFTDLATPPMTLGRPEGSSPQSIAVPDNAHNPRPWMMHRRRAESERILSHGGVFVMFASPVVFASYTDGKQPVRLTNWSLLSATAHPDNLGITEDHGDEVSVVAQTPITRVLQKYVQGVTYECRLSAPRTFYYDWKPVMLNKYGNPIGMMLTPHDTRKGWVFVLPHVSQRGELALDLVTQVLPNIAARLFPSAKSAAWTTEDAYELVAVAALRRQLQEVRSEAQQREKTIEQQILAERQRRGFLHTLLTGSGDELVEAVERTLALIGFDAVKNVDATAGRDLREDLQVEIGTGLALIEVKGIRGSVSDEEALQVLKYVAPRMRELERTDIRALTIVNHQRGEPPMSRSPKPFRELLVQTAEKDHCGLMTTWTLYRLARNFERLQWPHEAVASLLSIDGIIEPIPRHYESIGTVEKRVQRAIGVRLTAQLTRGDRIAVDGGTDYFEQDVDSLEIERSPVTDAPAGELVGIGTTWTAGQCPVGASVFRVKALA